MTVSGAAYAAEGEIEEVVVTGSRIARANLTSPTAVTTITAADIDQSGFINVADVMRTLPSFGVSALSSGNSNFLTTSSGINTLELRNLEEDRTLVLVNGRRYVSGLAGISAVDFNTIPTALIERMEIITGGASAIYGSDALAGVVNVILKDDFEGIETSYQYGEADAGGDVQHEWTFTAGGNFADGRGNAVLSATYSDQKGLLSRQRSNTEVDDVAECLFTGNAEDCDTEVEPFYSSFPESGRFTVIDEANQTATDYTVLNGTGTDGDVVLFDGDAHGFNRQHFRRYTVPTERYLVSTLLNYDVTSNFNAFAEAMFAQTRTRSELEPFPHSHGDLNIDGISIDNPFMPQELRDAAVAAGADEVGYARRTTELGQRGAGSTRDTYRLVVGLEGAINDTWSWETFYSYGRMDDAQQGGGQINVVNMRNALNAIDSPDGPVCADEAARAEGCVPINVFGFDAISAEAADYVRAPTSRQQLTEQQNFGASVAGPLFEVPAGAVDMAAGIEWRDESAEDVPDVLTQAGLNAGNAEAPTFGSYDVWEAFVEVEVPLIREVRGIYDLSVGGAYRFSDYSTVGNTDAYTARISYSPIEELRFRGQYARAVRAPNISELFAPGGENFASVTDPCNGVTATTPGNVAENCRSVPAIAARIAAVGEFELTQPEIQGTGGFTSLGNENLDAETSDSYSLGVVYDSDLGAVGDLTVSVDYFQIEIEDLIDTIDRDQSLTFCFNTSPANFPNEFCGNLTRDTEGPAFQQGELTEVNSGFINEGTLETEGVDVSVDFGWTLADWFGSVPGRAGVRVNYTYLLDFTETKFGEANDRVGETAYAEHEWQAGLNYSVGAFTASWEWVYIDDSVPLKSDELFAEYNVGSFSTHDLFVQYDLAASGVLGDLFAEGTSVYLGINNIFDEDAPVILTGVPGNVTGTDTDASVYNPIGRTYFAGVRVKL